MGIELKNVSKSYDSIEALKNISLQIKTGETNIIIGPSGCGKSTLIRIIIGLIKNDSGSVLINGKELRDININELRQNMGYVIQGGGLFPHLTAANNVSLLANYLNWNEKEIAERIKELCQLTKFPVDGLNRYPAELSGGQQQRVSLMRALMLNPEILLFDEPLGALDPLIRYNLQTDLKEIFQELNKTVVLVTHDLGEAAFLGDKLVLMREGLIVQIGSIEDFIKNPSQEFVTRFINAQRNPIEHLMKN
jgi:osmoprotectant transport system ATP-binding protein